MRKEVVDVNTIINIDSLFLLYKAMDVLSEALAQGITPAIVVALYLIIVKIIDNKKDKFQAKINSDLVKSITDISTFITTITKSTVERDKDKCKAAITDSMNHSAYKLIKFVVDTLINNHIDINKETILTNIKNITNAEYYTVYSTLSLYEYNGEKVSSNLKKEWISEVEQAIIKSIYSDKLTVEDKILSFSNKINIKFQSYITYIINNTIKN